MRIDIATLFPDMCEAVLSESIVGRARAAGHIEVQCTNIRDYANNKHNRVDDKPYGGGTGMVMQAQPIYDCIMPIRGKIPLCPSLLDIWFSLSNCSGLDVELDVGKGFPSVSDFGSCSLQNVKDCSIFISTENMPYVNGNENFQLYLVGNNKSVTPGSLFWPSTYDPKIKIAFGESEYMPPLLFNKYVFLTDTNYGTAFYKLTANTGLVHDGKQIWFNYRFTLSDYSLHIDFIPYLKDVSPQTSAETLAVAPMMAEAASVSAEPEMSDEAFMKAIDGKKGIFVKKDGMAYNLLTGEYVSE